MCGLDKQLKNTDIRINHTLLWSVDCLNLNEIYQVAHYQKARHISGHSGDPVNKDDPNDPVPCLMYNDRHITHPSPMKMMANIQYWTRSKSLQ